MQRVPRHAAAAAASHRSTGLLVTLLRLQRGGAGGSGSSADGQLSGAQLNEMLARGESEVELFEAEDARMQVGWVQCRATCIEGRAGRV